MLLGMNTKICDSSTCATATESTLSSDSSYHASSRLFVIDVDINAKEHDVKVPKKFTLSVGSIAVLKKYLCIYMVDFKDKRRGIKRMRYIVSLMGVPAGFIYLYGEFFWKVQLNQQPYTAALQHAVEPFAWTAGFMLITGTLQSYDGYFIRLYALTYFAVVTIATLSYLYNTGQYGYCLVWSLAGVVFVLSIEVLINMRHTLRYKYISNRIGLFDISQSYLVAGVNVLLGQVYLGCDTVGICVINRSEDTTDDFCNAYSFANLVTAYQLLLLWAVSVMLFDTGAISGRNLVLLRFRIDQWIGFILVGICVVVSLLAYVSKERFPPSYFVVFITCDLFAMFLIGYKMPIRGHAKNLAAIIYVSLNYLKIPFLPSLLRRITGERYMTGIYYEVFRIETSKFIHAEVKDR